jgi:hypothetical protein
MVEEELMFETQVRIGEHAVLRLEDGANAFAGCDDVESLEEIVVR